jgi:hypothetical protein
MPDFFKPEPKVPAASSLKGPAPVAPLAPTTSTPSAPVAPTAPVPKNSAIDNKVPQEPSSTPLLNAEVSTGFNPDNQQAGFEEGVWGNVDRATGYTSRLGQAGLKSLFARDPKYFVSAAQGNNTDLSTDIDQFVNKTDARFWSPLATIGPAINAVGGLVGQKPLSDQFIKEGVSKELGFNRGVLRTGAQIFLDPMSYATFGVNQLAKGGTVARALGKGLEVANELHPANLLVKAPLGAVDTVAKEGIALAAKAGGSTLVEDTAKAYGVAVRGYGSHLPLGGVLPSKAVLSSPQLLSYGLTSHINSVRLRSISSNFTKIFGIVPGHLANSKDFFQDLAREADPKFQLLKLAQDWEDTARPISDELVSKYKFSPEDAHNLILDMGQVRMGPIDKKLSRYYPEAYKEAGAQLNLTVEKTVPKSLAEKIEEGLQQVEAGIRARASAANIPEEDLLKYGGQISHVFNQYEDALVGVSQKALKAKSGEVVSPQVKQFHQLYNESAYKLVSDFEKTYDELAKIKPKEFTEVSSNLGAEELQKAVTEKLQVASPELIDQLLSRGAIAKLPLLNDEIVDIVLNKSTELSPLVKIDPKLQAVIEKQKKGFKFNPKVEYERSFQTIVKDIQKSNMADVLPSEAVKSGWGSFDKSLTKTKGYVKLEDRTLQSFGTKSEKLRGLYVHPTAKAMIENLVDRMTDPPALSKFMQYFNSVTGSWKAGVLSNPVTIQNNLVGNLAQYEIGKGKLWNLTKAVGILEELTTNPTKAYQENQWIRELIDQEVIVPDDLSKLISARGPQVSKVEKAKSFVVPTAKTGFVPKGIVDATSSINSTADEVFKIGMYLSKRAEGKPPEQARKHVFNYFYSGSDLSKMTRAEQEHIAPLLPFYRWFKNNLPGQIRNVVQNPFSALRQISLLQQMGVTGGARIPTKSAEPGAQGYVDDKGEVHSFNRSNALPIMDIVKLGTGLQELSQGKVLTGVQTATGIGPQQGLTPFVTEGGKIADAFLKSEKDDAGKVKPKNILGIDVAPQYAMMYNAVPGLRDFDIIVKATGLAGTGEVDRGVLTPNEPGRPGALGGNAPQAKEYRSALTRMANWLGSPSDQLASLKDFSQLKPKDRSATVKGLLGKSKELATRGENGLAQKMQDYATKLDTLNTAITERDADLKAHPNALKKESDAASIEELIDIKLDKGLSSLSGKLKDMATTDLKDLSKESKNPGGQ